LARLFGGVVQALSALSAPPSAEDIKQLMILAAAARAPENAAQLLEQWSTVLSNEQFKELAQRASEIR
jgi:hypothetical protein